MAPVLPPLSTIRVFEVAARHQSFTQAAKELGMTQAAVSYQIKMLEDRIGAPLFRRLPRQVVLTEIGRQLAPSVRDAFETLRMAFAELRDSSERNLAITSLHTFSVRWLLPRLDGFRRAHPALAVLLSTDNRMADLMHEEVDIGLRSGTGVWSGLDAHLLFPLTFTPLASPALLERHGGVSSPADLLRLPLVTPTDSWWRDWFALAGVPDPDLQHRTDVSLQMQDLAGAAAMGGSGVAVLTPEFFSREIADGRLIQLFDLIGHSSSSMWLVYKQSRRRSPKIRAFRDWMLAEAAADRLLPRPLPLNRELERGSFSHSAAWAFPSSARKPPD